MINECTLLLGKLIAGPNTNQEMFEHASRLYRAQQELDLDDEDFLKFLRKKAESDSNSKTREYTECLASALSILIKGKAFNRLVARK